LILTSAACGQGADPTDPGADAEPATTWVRLAESPLSPRTGATGVWTGEDVLVFGGEQVACPPNADCAPPDEPALQDGAAYNPATDTWRRITTPLVPVRYAHTAVIGDAVYVWAHSSYDAEASPVFMRYSIPDDTWTSLPPPTADGQGAAPSIRGMVVTGAGDRLVGYSSSDEQGEQPDWLYDPVGGWTQLPDDPHTPAFDRSMTWAADRLVLFDKELVANPGSERPSLGRAAVLDLSAGVWETLPPSETLAYGPWFADNGRLIDPALGSADGGEVNNWGRHYPNGGILDLAGRRWQSLPAGPSDASFSAGVLGSQGAMYTGYRGVVLDLAAERWLTVPELEEPRGTSGRTVVAVGTDLFVFGGVDWADPGGARFHNDGWRWAPRAQDAG
jgi:hypothetical protein